MIEVKADALEESFERLEDDEDGVAALKAELELLKSKIASGAIAAQRRAAPVRRCRAAGRRPVSVDPTAPWIRRDGMGSV